MKGKEIKLIFFYLSVALAGYLHGKSLDKGFIRIDMSEFQHKVNTVLIVNWTVKENG